MAILSRKTANIYEEYGSGRFQATSIFRQNCRDPDYASITCDPGRPLLFQVEAEKISLHILYEHVTSKTSLLELI